MNEGDWAATTRDPHKLPSRFFQNVDGATALDEAEVQDEVSMTVEMSTIRSELSRIRRDMETILKLLSYQYRRKSTPQAPILKGDYDLADCIGMWSDLDDEDMAIFDEVIEERTTFLNGRNRNNSEE